MRVFLDLSLWIALLALASCTRDWSQFTIGCPAPQMECAGRCVDITSDPAHCGGCDQRCGPETLCQSRSCVPVQGPDLTDASTLDAASDGAVDVPSVCTPPREACENACVDVRSDAAHCGACGDSCPTRCVDGACERIVQMALGSEHTCALTHSHRVYCWGHGEGGRIGVDIATSSVVPTDPVIEGAAEIAAGDVATCARLHTGEVHCWGDNRCGLLGGVDTGASFLPRPLRDSSGEPIRDAVEISLGTWIGCYRTESGQVRCWGTKHCVRPGLSPVATPSPEPVMRTSGEPLSDARALGVGENFGCAIAGDGSVVCFGDDYQRRLGRGGGQLPAGWHDAAPVQRWSGSDPPTETPIDHVESIAVGQYHACAVRASSTPRVWCWGWNAHGVLTDARTPVHDLRAAVAQRISELAQPLVEPTAELVSGSNFVCTLRERDGALGCWGRNDTGQLAAAPTGARTTPVVLSTTTRFVGLAAASEHACGWTETGTAYCWGSSANGILGNGLTAGVHSPSPARVLWAP